MEVKINGYSHSEGTREFDILSREQIEDIIDNLSPSIIFKVTFEESHGITHSGTAYTYVDARNGNIRTAWLGQGSFNHPWDSFYEIIICSLITGTGAIDFDNPEDFISSEEEWNVWKEFDGSLEEFFGTVEYCERLENIVDWESDEFILDHDDITWQLDEMYRV